MTSPTILNGLTIADTLRRINAENSRWLRGVIDAETFATRVSDEIVRCDKIMERNVTDLRSHEPPRTEPLKSNPRQPKT